MTSLKTHMYNWLINYNPYTKNWQAARRDNADDLYSNISKCIKSDSLTTLVEILNKTDGDEELLNKLIDNDN